MVVVGNRDIPIVASAGTKMANIVVSISLCSPLFPNPLTVNPKAYNLSNSFHILLYFFITLNPYLVPV